MIRPTNTDIHFRKDRQWVVYNSTFRNGVKYSHMHSIAQCMNMLVIPNDNYGLLIGIGNPDSLELETLPPFDCDLADSNPDYLFVYRNFVWQCYTPKHKATFFQRLYQVDKALSGKLPLSQETSAILSSNWFGFKPVPFDKALVVPKPSHMVFPKRYDQNPDNYLAGQFEPPKGGIANQYIFVPNGDVDGDGRTSSRLRLKQAEQRNIQVTAFQENSMPIQVRVMRNMNILAPDENEQFESGYRNTIFDVAFLPMRPLDLEQAMLIGRTLSAAAEDGHEAVFAVPYKSEPRTTEDFGYPFRQALGLRNFIADGFRGHADELDNVHITYVETEDNGIFDLNEATIPYLPDNFFIHNDNDDWTLNQALKHKRNLTLH